MGAHTGTAYSMSAGIGRSYRYYKGEALFKFGTGLSLTTFNISCAPSTDVATTPRSEDSTTVFFAAQSPPGPPMPIYRRAIVTCAVTNTGTVAGDEVLLVYHAVGAKIRATASKLHPVPLKQLVDFERFSDVGPRGSAQKTFSFDPYTSLALTAANGSKVVYPGEHQLIFSTGVPSVPDVVHTISVL